MNISLIRVPTIIDSTASTAPICPPIGMAYLNTVVKKFTNDVLIIDSIGNHPVVREITNEDGYNFKLLGQTSEEIVSELKDDVEMILISIMFSQDWVYSRKLLTMIRKKCPNSLIVAGGEHITAVPEFSLNASPEIDICVLGEGELTLTEIISNYQNNKTLPSTITGTYIRLPNGKVVKNTNQKRVKNLAELGWPDWEGFPLKNYFDGGHSFGVSPIGSITMPILASRGCPYECTFCSNKLMWGQYWKVRTPEDVISEMKIYIEKYKVNSFDFYDLTAIVKRKWIIEFCHQLIESELNITWQLPSGTRSEAIDDEVCKLLFDSGCRNLSYAPESGSEEVLHMIKKKISLENLLVSLRSASKHGISVKINIICGFPKEKIYHLFQTLWFLMKVAMTGCDDMSINQFSPYPGSPLFNDLVKNSKLKLDDEYFKTLSYYSSMANAHSYCENLTNKQLIIYKYSGTLLFYLTSFIRRPWRVFAILKNVYLNNETTRLEKSLVSYKKRFTFKRVIVKSVV
jgi:anaerobic magnesium-protoporphyrin IX monomethyl ester cyclase